MLNETKNFIPDAFDDLLLQSILSDYSNNPEIQKSLDMTANYVYSASATIAVPKEIENRFINPSGKSIIFNFLLNKFFIITFGIVMLGYVSINLLNKKPDNKPAKSLLAINPIDTNKIEENMMIKVDTTIKTEIAKNQNYGDSVSPKPTFKTSINADNSGSTMINFPKYNSRRNVFDEEFDEQYAESIILNSNRIPIYRNKNFGLDGFKTEIVKPNEVLMMSKRSNMYGKNYSIIPMYFGVPFTKGFENMSYFSIAKDATPLTKSGSKSPILFRLLKSTNLYQNFDDTNLNIYTLFEKDENLSFLRPFYFSNQELSNQNYREFLYWVAKYNGIENPNLSNLDSLLSIKEYLIYPFHNLNSEYKKRTGKNSINVLPNVNCWKTDFPYSFNDPMVKHYFTHPAYNNYPIVGISYWQAMAYLDWLTWIWQSRIDAQNIPYQIDFDLPTAYEWEMASMKILKGLSIDFIKIPSVCNLSITHQHDLDLREELGIRWKGSTDDYFHTSMGNSQRTDIPNYELKILNLDCNVSEWLQEDYSTNWQPYISTYRTAIKNENKKGNELLLLLEKYFDDEYNDKNGKLVQGGNWFDKRDIDVNTDNADGMFAKVFVHPDSSHSTLGFRYVMHVHLKNEAQIIKKIRVLGRDMPKIDYTLMKSQIKPNDSYTKDPYGFMFIPMGTFHHNDSLKSVQAFYAMETEVNNLTWFLFLNYLIDNNREEDLKECIPNDPEWALKMNYEKFPKFPEKYLKSLPFSSEFIRQNKIRDLGWTNFAYLPVVGISKKAAKLFANWLTIMSGSQNDFRLPYELEYEWMAYGGLSDTNLYSWNGQWLRDSRGLFLARFISSSNALDFKKPSDLSKFDYLINNQNREFTFDINDSLWQIPNGPMPCGYFPSNKWGIYDISGNVAEMVNEDGFTKGGSWASPAYYIRIKEQEKWGGKASDCVGFRLVMTYLGKPAGK